MTRNKPIQCYEHETLKFDSHDHLFLKLQKMYGLKGVPYFSLGHNCVKFNEYVGVIQVGLQVIEVLPKADRSSNFKMGDEEQKESWKRLLIDMIKKSGVINVKSTGSSNLKLSSNSILDLYFELFLNEIEYLIHRGLLKKYKKAEGNIKSLKGSISFNKHIQHNHIHQERFYTKHTVYTTDHLFHQILKKALDLIKSLVTDIALKARILKIDIEYPEVASINITKSTFDNIVYNRQNERYRNAIDIAKLLLLNYHPDIIKGEERVLALMFDMNVLWEKFVIKTLKKKFITENLPFNINGQVSKEFWASMHENVKRIRPDIVIIPTDKEEDGNRIILDTKWKNIDKSKDISLDILRQMYVYHEYFNAKKVAIIFPGEIESIKGNFVPHKYTENIEKKCAMLPIPVSSKIEDLHNSIFNIINNWIHE